MINITIILILGMIFGFFCIIIDGAGIIDNIKNKIVIYTLLILSILCFAIIGIFFCLKGTIREEPYKIDKIVALQDNNTISGKSLGLFYCYSGYIDGKMQYQYIIETDDGAMITKHISIDDVYIYYSNDARIEYTRKIKTLGIFYTIENSIIKMYIPKGSICYDMN